MIGTTSSPTLMCGAVHVFGHTSRFFGSGGYLSGSMGTGAYKEDLRALSDRLVIGKLRRKIRHLAAESSQVTIHSFVIRVRAWMERMMGSNNL